ncbi:MAG TPA: hypothetical protein VGQ83_35120 [Polyangia bacterium]
MIRARSWSLWAPLLGCGALVLVRVAQAAAGAIPAARAAGEAGVVLGLVLVSLLAVRVAQAATTTAWVLLGLTIVVWGAAVLVPLWRLAHPPATLFAGRLGGATREVSTAPSPRGGRYLVEVRRPGRRAAETSASATYLLHAGAGRTARTLTGADGATSERAELRLVKGQPLKLFLERSDEPTLEVGVRPVPLPWWWVGLGAIVAALLAIPADIVGFTSQPRLRGLLAAAVTASAIYVSLLDPEAVVTGRQALGAGGLAIVGGGLIGGAVGPIVGRLTARRRAAVSAAR